MVAKAKWKPLELPLAGQHSEPITPGESTEISASIKNLKDARWCFLPCLPLTRIFGLCRRQTDCED